MKNLYKKKLDDVWEISKNKEKKEWVKKDLDKNYIRWNNDNRIVVLMSELEN